MKNEIRIKVKSQKNTDWKILLFFANAISMILELVAARILSPYFGSSNAVWTIIISIMLLSGAIGNYLGGIWADRYRYDVVNITILLTAAISTLIIAFINRTLAFSTKINLSENNIKTATFICCLFMIPCICIGILSPIVSKVVLNDDNKIGTKSGEIYTIITAGSLLGTILGGFYLIPRFGSNSIVYYLSCFLFVLSLFFLQKLLNKNIKKTTLIVLVVMIIFCGAGEIVYQTSGKDIKDEEMIILDTGESYVKIYNDAYNGEDIKVMSLSGGFSSAIFLDEKKENELVFEYTKAYNKVMEKKKDIKDYLMIGGAGYSYPRYIISHFPDKNMDVVEIDGKITEIARKYFGLNEFLDKYEDNRLNLITDDGRIFLEKNEKK